MLIAQVPGHCLLLTLHIDITIQQIKHHIVRFLTVPVYLCHCFALFYFLFFFIYLFIYLFIYCYSRTVSNGMFLIMQFYHGYPRAYLLQT